MSYIEEYKQIMIDDINSESLFVFHFENLFFRTGWWEGVGLTKRSQMAQDLPSPIFDPGLSDSDILPDFYNLPVNF